MSARKQTAASKRREATRLGNAFANRASELIRTMQIGLNACAGEVLGDEVEEADAFAQDEIAKKVAECNGLIAQANGNTERVERARVADREAAAEKLTGVKAELKEALRYGAGQMEGRIKAENRVAILERQLNVVRAQVAHEETK